MEKWAGDSFDNFSKEELISIIKGTVLLGEIHLWETKSVHPAVPIIKLFREQYPDECEDLDKWVLKCSSNDWLPWGHPRDEKK